jgi:hypothetical protein
VRARHQSAVTHRALPKRVPPIPPSKAYSAKPARLDPKVNFGFWRSEYA